MEDHTSSSLHYVYATNMQQIQSAAGGVNVNLPVGQVKSWKFIIDYLFMTTNDKKIMFQ